MLLLQFIILLAVFNDSTCGNNDRNTPVFILDHDGCCESLHILSSNPLHQVDHIEFTDIIQHVNKQSKLVIIFVEENFSVEDITTKDVMGTPYNYLRNSLKHKRVQYFPSVLDPYQILTQKFPQNSDNVLYLGHVPMLPDDNTKYFYVFFVDGVNETRVESLRRHDSLIAEVYLAIRKIHSGYVTGIYTGKVNPILKDSKPFKHDIKLPKQAEGYIRVESDGALFKFKGLKFVSPLRTTKLIQEPLVGEETWFRRRMNTHLCTKMSYTDFELQFDFKFTKGDWKLEKVILLEGGEQVGMSFMGVGAPWGYSYVCGDPMVINNKRDYSSIIIDSYKIQAFARIPVEIIIEGDSSDPELDIKIGDEVSDLEANSTDIVINGTDIFILNSTYCCKDKQKEFGKAVHCGAYFTANILSSFLVALLCMGILCYAVIAMFEIKTNDRFGDPREKPLYSNY